MNSLEDRHACLVGGERRLTPGETALVCAMFGSAIDTATVRIKRSRWFPFQPRETLMAPCGHIHFHPQSSCYCDDFSAAPLADQGLFLHEMTHVWQTQTHGWWYLPLCRPFSSRYEYSIMPGAKLAAYGIEQQAEIVRHAFLLRHGIRVLGVGNAKVYEDLVKF